MQQSNFSFLRLEFPLLCNLAQSAEYHLYTDATISVFKLRQFGEKLTELIYKIHFLDLPYQDGLNQRIKDLKYEGILQDNISSLLTTIRIKGNIGVHQIRANENDATTAIYSAFKVSKWFVQTYGELNYEAFENLRFSKPPNLDSRHALHLLEKEYASLEEELEKYKAQLKKLTEQEEQQIKVKSKNKSNRIELNEAETRTIIDEQLREAGWIVDTATYNFKTQRTIPQRGKNIAIAEWKVGNLWADYALFIGTELYGIVEAKRYSADISTNLRQSKVYSENAEATNEAKLLGDWRGNKVPFLFSANGRKYLEQLKTKSGIWFWDVRKERSISRPLRGWFSPEGLKKLYEQDIDRAEVQLKEDSFKYLQQGSGLNLRNYQIKAIQAVEQKILAQPEDQRALLAMATGTGKTRTIIGLCYRLIKSNRFRRILFLVDRRLLASQAFDSFQDNKVEDLNTFSEIYHVAKLKELIPETETRLHFATVQSMVKRLFYGKEEATMLPIDTYDCIIVDEAHRGYLLDREMDDEEIGFKDQKDYVSKYRRVIDYFDAFVIGLTATPALHTKEIFGKPVFNYTYREAVIDGWLIDHEPPFNIKTQLNTEGIIWEAGEKPKVLDAEENKIVELDELEDELKIEVEGFNKKVITESFNRTVVQQLVKRLDPEGREKTLIFAARDGHADLLVSLLKEEFAKIDDGVPNDAIAKITGKSYKPQELLAKFKNEKYPNIVVTVDLLTTGIDVPAICNLVFLRRIRSRILYDQMIGRATRLCPEINKEVFHIYDAVKIYEALQDFTNMKPVSINPKASFQQLVDEMESIQSVDRTEKQIEQIIAKLHRKKQYVQGEEIEKFEYNAKGKTPEDLIGELKTTDPSELKQTVQQYTGLWKYLDELKPPPKFQLVSEHQDVFMEMEQSYGDYEKPEDYLEGFNTFIQEHRNKITALNIICSKPAALDRQSLKELRLLLDQKGFNTRMLNKAWKQAKNEDIAADIVSYIRSLAIGTDLVAHEVRIKNAITKIKAQQDWSKKQLNWIDRFEKQLLAESIIKKEDLDKAPFSNEGGYKRLNKIFDNQLDGILDQLNEFLYPQAG